MEDQCNRCGVTITEIHCPPTEGPAEDLCGACCWACRYQEDWVTPE